MSTGLGAAAGLGDAAGKLAAAGLDVVALPVRTGAKALSGEVSRSTLTRRCGRGDGRIWIEVRGLDGTGGAARGRAAVAALRAQPGVTNAVLNRPLSRVVVEIDDGASPDDLCAALDAVEKDDGTTDSARCDSLPGDGLLLAARGAMVAVNAAGFAVAVAGRALRLPAAPIAVEAVSAIANYQPWLRRALEAGIGPGATNTALSLFGTAAHVVTLSPAKLSVDLAMQAFRAAECRAAARAWARYEPELARHADEPEMHRLPRPVPAPAGPVDRHGKRVAWAQLIGVGLTGALTRNVTMASNAALAASPKAMRTSHEAFAATLGRGLADRHAVLPLRPEGLRRLDKVDALLIDPRVLCGEAMRVVRVRGARDGELFSAWTRAQELLDEGAAPGWHRVDTPSIDEPVEALIAPAAHPLASALITRARDSGARLVSVDTELLGDLRPAFDDVLPVGNGGIDDELADAVSRLQHDGHTVAVLSSSGAQALSGADVALGIRPSADTPPPWNADLMMEDLAAAWLVLHALPAAREASRQGIAISVGASALGALFMVPGVRRLRGPGPVTVGAVAGMLSGYLLARGAIRTPTPRPAPAYEWHAMSAEQAREVLAALRDPDERSAATEPAEGGTGFPAAAWEFARAAAAELTGDPLTPILGLCSAATALLGSPTDAVMVGTVLTGNAMLSTYQQLQAEKRLNRLLAQQAPPARLVTDARRYREVVVERLRPGDVIEVRSDEVVPADARVIEAHDLEVDESSLTGESLSVQKRVEATPGAELAERRCMIYAGTTVVAGTAVAVVTAVGADTQTRRAAELASGELPTVGLHHQLSQLMRRAFPFSAGGGVAVGALGLLRAGGLRQALSSAIAVSVAAIPEGMPLMATLAQSASAQRLGEAGALVRVPRAAEALGRVEVVCFDKTGTLSENRLRVAEVRPMAGHSREDVLRCAARAAPADDGNPHVHATDEAIVKAADAVADSGSRPEPDAHLPFRSGRAFSASVTGTQLTVKGAPEVVLAACPNVGGEVEDAVAALTTAGLRTIAVAQRRLSAAQARSLRNDPDGITELCGAGLTLTGFLGLSDTPRPQAPQLLADLADRGVAIRLITGDHPVTATAIARELGVPVSAGQVITGAEWNALSRPDQVRAVGDRVIFARMSPENKVQVVQTLERSGRVCAMVGDGANDAAAIRAASVGVGVVARGSDSAHTTADVVLTDGRIETLVAAIDEGRRLWRGVQAAVAGLLAGNAGEVIFSVIGTAITGTSPLNTRQLLLMNMLTDALPATAVAVSTPAGPVQRVGRGIDERALRRAVAARGSITAVSATAAWALASVTGLPQRASTVALISLVAVELGQTVVDSHAPLVLLTAAGSFAAFAAMITTPGISQLVGCTPVGPVGWAQGLGTAAAAVLAVAATNRLRSGHRDAESPLTDGPELDEPAESPPQPAQHSGSRAPHTAMAPAKAARALKLVDRHQHRISAEAVTDRP
ncbi:metal cation transporting p-type ATPase CtpH [Mycobacterium europaeum]|uniref:Metal cation transporting P-type ATPase CtpH n=1 Tax=Mycobacterium europaeum TaxID=761804 RepID=A0A0U1DFY0_9MYCO|nr:HAD-IC family P-type ATPase [Mycobacterium europaeum]CQD15597.1 metal cation transporting p-type ATPase CtpH [Mycobacterium europaeum]